MSNFDRSASGRLTRLKAKTLAVYHENNPGLNDYGGVKPSNAATLLLRLVGEKIVCETCTSCTPVCDISGEAFFIPFIPFDISGGTPWPDIGNLNEILFEITGESNLVPDPPIGFPEDRLGLFILLPEVCNATSYYSTIDFNDSTLSQTQYTLGPYTTEFPFPRTTFIISYPLSDYDETITVNITAANECSDSTAIATFGCFLEGSQIAMADGTFKAIENVEVGDSIQGAFGETNSVLALHRPILGAGSIININNEHKTTTHHPHVAADKAFYCGDPKIINNFTYGKMHEVIVDKSGKKERRQMLGLNRERIQKLEVGIELQTLTGARRVNTIESIKMSPLTKVYHLATSGSHTYIVDGYAVTGWPREDDFDYDAWTSRA